MQFKLFVAYSHSGDGRSRMNTFHKNMLHFGCAMRAHTVQYIYDNA